MSSTGAGMSLEALLDGFVQPDSIVPSSLVVGGMTLDSRNVKAGDVFIAIPGSASDGRDYIARAISQGAIAVLLEAEGAEQFDVEYAVPLIKIAGLARMVGRLADRFYGSPSSRMTVVGVTGTNGKTTCAHIIAQALDSKDARSIYIGTIGYGFIGELDEASHTTPDPITLHRVLAHYYRLGARSVCMEVSSHALEQGRVEGISFDVAVFTNLSRDHLDYHGTMDAYGAAKELLFCRPELRAAVVNADDDFGRDLLARLRGKEGLEVIAYGVHDGEIKAEDIMPQPGGLKVTVRRNNRAVTLRSSLFGHFNAYNLIAAFSVLTVVGHSEDEATNRLSMVHSVSGRAEAFHGKEKSPWVFVDYAHTPDALEKILGALREHAQGQVWCVFGCGGNRDKGKRPIMGQIAERLADRVILTDDNPRHEDPGQIIHEIMIGMTMLPEVIQPREKAIRSAVNRAGEKDIVLVAGKGHENYQQIGDQRIHFSDREIVKHLLEEAA